MKIRAHSATVRGKVDQRSGASPLIKSGGDLVLVERGQPRLIVMRCPCGCNDDLVINLDRRVGPAWRFYASARGPTLFPSYWRDTKCKSHFILWNGQIYWCYGKEESQSDTRSWTVDAATEQSVLAALPRDRFTRYEAIAEEIQLVPWDVLQACWQLELRKLVERRPGVWRGEFRRV